jgi:5-methylcytosine-specific restriction endonuclease McrA
VAFGFWTRRGQKMPRGTYLNKPSSQLRPERNPARRKVFEHNKKIILATQSVCGICGQPIDKSIKYPDPMSPTVDHIIPCAKGGSDDLDNLQLAHRKCNRMKSDQMPEENKKRVDLNRDLPQSANWRTY